MSFLIKSPFAKRITTYSAIFRSFSVLCDSYAHVFVCYFISELLKMRLTAEKQRKKSFARAALRDKRRVGDFTIPKIDNSGRAFYGVAAKLHDAFPRPHVSQRCIWLRRHSC